MSAMLTSPSRLAAAPHLRRTVTQKRRSHLNRRVTCMTESGEVTIRRRPPRGTAKHSVGPMLFEVNDQDEDSKPRNILEEIVWFKNREIEEMRGIRPISSLIHSMKKATPPRDFKQRILDVCKQTGIPTLIAEVKKASPSKGVIQPNFDPVRIAQQYEKGGATCLSVLTDKKYFQGGFENLRMISNSGVSCPLLCKEFIVDAYQLFMARVYGADAVLLIAAVLPNADLDYFMKAAKNLGMQCLIEVHNERELKRVTQLDGLEDHLVGINNRDLESFAVDLRTTARLLSTPAGIDILDRDIVVVGESGIYTKTDVDVLKQAGCNAILVGESLVKESDPARAVQELLGKSV